MVDRVLPWLDEARRDHPVAVRAGVVARRLADLGSDEPAVWRDVFRTTPDFNDRVDCVVVVWLNRKNDGDCPLDCSGIKHYPLPASWSHQAVESNFKRVSLAIHPDKAPGPDDGFDKLAATWFYQRINWWRDFFKGHGTSRVIARWNEAHVAFEELCEELWESRSDRAEELKTERDQLLDEVERLNVVVADLKVLEAKHRERASHLSARLSAVGAPPVDDSPVSPSQRERDADEAHALAMQALEEEQRVFHAQSEAKAKAERRRDREERRRGREAEASRREHARSRRGAQKAPRSRLPVRDVQDLTRSDDEDHDEDVTSCESSGESKQQSFSSPESADEAPEPPEQPRNIRLGRGRGIQFSTCKACVSRDHLDTDGLCEAHYRAKRAAGH